MQKGAELGTQNRELRGLPRHGDKVMPGTGPVITNRQQACTEWTMDPDHEVTMLLSSVETGFPYGLMVVAAPESTDSHDDWDASTETVHARPDSLYIGVRQAASGLVRVSCFEGDEPQSELELLFTGTLLLPSARLRVYDPDETISMVLSVEGRSPAVAIYADDDEEPSKLEIYLSYRGM